MPPTAARFWLLFPFPRRVFSLQSAAALLFVHGIWIYRLLMVHMLRFAVKIILIIQRHCQHSKIKRYIQNWNMIEFTKLWGRMELFRGESLPFASFAYFSQLLSELLEEIRLFALRFCVCVCLGVCRVLKSFLLFQGERPAKLRMTAREHYTFAAAR